MKAAATTATLQPQTDLQTSQRINSVDILRGVIMVLMAIDHVRVYAGIPAGGPDAGVFFTRWVTHFCAPGFAFFAGTSAFLYGMKLKDSAKLAKYLVTRGLMLVILEITLIRFLWAFNVNYSEFMLAGVIWMLGWCMVLLAAFVKMRPKIVGIIGVAIIFLQQFFALVPRLFSSEDNGFTRFWEFIYSSGFESYPAMNVLYVIVPWIGVMMAGYGFGTILLMEEQKRKKICVYSGIGGFLLYLVAGSIFASLQQPDNGVPFLFRLLNQQKYPASQLFLLMTISPMILLVPYLENAKNWISNAFAIIGRVPFFYYLLHIIIIHVSALVVNSIRTGDPHHDWYWTAPYTFLPEETRWSLLLLYLIFIIDVTVLFVLCKWYSNYKAKHPEKAWLKYL